MMGPGQEHPFYSFNLEDYVRYNHLLSGIHCHLDLGQHLSSSTATR